MSKVFWQSDNSDNIEDEDYVLTLVQPFYVADDDEVIEEAAYRLESSGFYTRRITRGLVAFHEDNAPELRGQITEVLGSDFEVI
jgi:hypothetical protein